MVCPRCIKAVEDGLTKMGYQVTEVHLGFATVNQTINKKAVGEMLASLGFELLSNNDQKTIERIKNFIINLVQNQNATLHQNLSSELSNALNIEYHQLSTLFSALEGITIERYFILQRIEKAKELIVYNELSLKEIAFQLGFSSVAHLSAQFKKETGFTTSHFKEIGANKRKSLDQL